MQLLLASSPALSPALRDRLWSLWLDAFEGDFDVTDAEHAYGGAHAILLDRGVPVAHASVVPRDIHVGTRVLAAGYVEGVAVATAEQGRGHGTRVMRLLDTVLRKRYEIGVLGTGEHAFYERLGWERWRGPSSVLTTAGRVRSEEEDDGIMVLRLDGTDVDLAAPIACEDRPGDAW